jgi:hypothetical protein
VGHLRGGIGSDAERDKQASRLQESGRPHDTSTVRNMPISM